MRYAIALCYQSMKGNAGKFDSHYLEYITRLRDGVKQHSTVEQDIICFTDKDFEVDGVIIRKFPDTFRGWHCRNVLFKPDSFIGYDRVLYIDLDTIITNNIDAIWEDDSDFCLLKDVLTPTKQWQYGVFTFNPNLEFIQNGEMYEFCSKQLDDPNKSSATVFNNFLKQKLGQFSLSFMQDKYQIASYKGDICSKKRSASNYQFVCYHGAPYCHHTQWSVTPVAVRPVLHKIRLEQQEQAKAKPPKPEPVRAVQFETLTPIWKDEDVFVIGGGPSLKYVDLDKFLMDKKVIGVNDAYLFKCTKILFFGDVSWFNKHGELIKDLQIPIYSTSGIGQYGIKKMLTIGSKFSDQPMKLFWGGNSGDAAMNMALLLGAKRVFLLGFDKKKDGRESNWHENIRPVSDGTYRGYLKHETKILEGLQSFFKDREVINVEVNEGDSVMTIYDKILFKDLFDVEQDEIYVTDRVAYDLTMNPLVKHEEQK